MRSNIPIVLKLDSEVNIKEAVADGVMSDYKTKSDQPHSCDDHPFRRRKDIIAKALELDPKGYFFKSGVQAALIMMLKGNNQKSDLTTQSRYDCKLHISVCFVLVG